MKIKLGVMLLVVACSIPAFGADTTELRDMASVHLQRKWERFREL